jgi:hypothetical protein
LKIIVSLHLPLTILISYVPYRYSESIPTNNSRTIPKQDKPKSDKLPPHPYKIADDSYRAMMRGIENGVLMNSRVSETKDSVSFYS